MGFPLARVGNCGRCRRCSYGPLHLGCTDSTIVVSDDLQPDDDVLSLDYTVVLDAPIPPQLIPHLLQALMTSDVGAWFGRCINLFAQVLSGKVGPSRNNSGAARCACPPGQCWTDLA